MNVMIAVLLIYSLLMITTETKTFDTGVMRLPGLSSSGFVSMILIQATYFVLPVIISAYICLFPSLYFIFKKLNIEGTGVSIIPNRVATLEAVGVGLLIPAVSSIITIQRSLTKTLSESLDTSRSIISGTVRCH